jgi:hypothetical protein
MNKYFNYIRISFLCIGVLIFMLAILNSKGYITGIVTIVFMLIPILIFFVLLSIFIIPKAMKIKNYNIKIIVVPLCLALQLVFCFIFFRFTLKSKSNKSKDNIEVNSDIKTKVIE